ncbi:MAG: LacI family DNA-binding transcriptional regulator [Spirochaetes bacterium]|nr:LacI family DNA-binding transcriptional regulator [Spirochaetota bacterium]
MVTIRDVAKKAGCSTATVSRVINKKGKYTAETEKRVKLAIRALGYRVNITARRLKRGQTMCVGIVTSEYRLLNTPELIRTSVRYLAGCGFNVELILGQPPESYISLLDEGRFDGLLVTDIVRDERTVKLLVDSGLHFVLLGGETDREDIHRVEIDYFTGGYEATKLLIRNGHSEILFLSDGQPGSVTEEIKRGYLFALDEHGIGYRENLIMEYARPVWTEQGRFGYETAKRALLSERFSALFAVHDRIAYGAVAAFLEQNVGVPSHCSVIGFGNTDGSAYFTLPLTSVAVPVIQMAELGCEILSASIIRKDNVVKSVRLKPRLVERKSVVKRLTP